MRDPYIRQKFTRDLTFALALWGSWLEKTPLGAYLNGMTQGEGVYLMTTLAKLIERLQERPGPEEREQIEHLLEQINAALDSLDQAGPGTSD